jgi:hypothetical protein
MDAVKVTGFVSPQFGLLHLSLSTRRNGVRRLEQS